ncbi:uncharacterized protein BO72DRAFT_199687 [Aspergillus fijiensis CBS 313.89]|uniref:Uncharacterized protein n=1 Tax=Aspergillus fijiensis CBS 313.89 TaxID=1448319 RepID=A0A8G1VWT9_9EURO|nr:uncharacterized protein BO72DRAFT_199687 [Aspergillus fijiensis CBS 313.89]RAK74536.1 hypothetical protein BO72DRAFT_199687 [Aspergillus fijiensis CBS 313.89]
MMTESTENTATTYMSYCSRSRLRQHRWCLRTQLCHLSEPSQAPYGCHPRPVRNHPPNWDEPAQTHSPYDNHTTRESPQPRTAKAHRDVKASRKSTPKAETQARVTLDASGLPPPNHSAPSVEMSTNRENPLIGLFHCYKVSGMC